MEETLHCKTCETPLAENDNYCSKCGAVVINERLTIKSIWQNFADDVLGWDNRYFYTIKLLFIRPDIVFSEYLGGVRKKYVSPFTFLTVAVTLATLLFNQFADEYVSISDQFYNKEMEYIEKITPGENNEEYQKRLEIQKENNREFQLTMIKNFNIYTFILIPLYALITFLVFGKPYNYGEHLVITSYAQGFLFLTSIVFFLLSIFVHPFIYYVNVIAAIYFYLYSYGRLYHLKPWQYVVKFLKFIGITLILMIALIIIVAVVVVLTKIKSFN